MRVVDTVLCFDRDYTIDVNAHPEYDAVPLAWVKAWAHSPKYDHIDVWATGNQHLITEAQIPGIEHARVCWERLEGRDASDEYPSEGYHSYSPARREGLRLIKDCYEHPESGYGELPRFIVIDDVNLSDLSRENWDWWFPWEFTESVREQGEPLPQPTHTEYPNVSAESNDDANQYTISASVLK